MAGPMLCNTKLAAGGIVDEFRKLALEVQFNLSAWGGDS